mmetsp:Transcript_22638/g.25774  ORF Transcript_22638/g.25774 Transcript_22638/m.25774 type:complete len:84 (+) Transcript_22638:286-537(+)
MRSLHWTMILLLRRRCLSQSCMDFSVPPMQSSVPITREKRRRSRTRNKSSASSYEVNIGRPQEDGDNNTTTKELKKNEREKKY